MACHFPWVCDHAHINQLHLTDTIKSHLQPAPLICLSLPAVPPSGDFEAWPVQVRTPPNLNLS